MKINNWLLIALIAVLSCACSDHFKTEQNFVTYKVAVVMPHDRQDEWNRVAQWALENIEEAQLGLTHGVKLSLHWFDENSSDIDSNLKNLANDDSYVAIIGPYSSHNAHIAADYCAKSGKTLIMPIATSAEVQRIYAKVNNIWNLTQSDISQCELMLVQAILSESWNVSLIASDDDYGKSFSDWFGYQAEELGIKVKDICICASEDEVKSAVNTVAGNFKYGDHLLLALSQEKYAIAFDQEIAALKANSKNFKFPLVLCSDVMNSPNLAGKLQNLTYEGLSPCAAPFDRLSPYLIS